MPMKPGDVVPTSCQGEPNKIQSGVFFGFLKLICGPNSPLSRMAAELSNQKSKLAKASRKTDYEGVFNNHNLKVCEIPGEHSRLLKTELRTRPKCVFNGHAGVIYRVDMVYAEATNPFNRVVSAHTIEEKILTGNSLSWTTATDSIGDPHARGSSGSGSVSFNLEVIDDNPTNACAVNHVRSTVTLQSLGKSVSHIYNGIFTPIIRTDECGFISSYDSWVGGNFDNEPVGLIMELDVRVDWIGYSG